MAESITECDYKLIYEKRPGSYGRGVGYDYESYVSVLFAVKLALDDGVHDAQIARDVCKYGTFDDTVIRVQYKNGSTILYLFKFKYKNRQKTVNFTTKTGADFSLEKCKDSDYKYIKAKISRGEQDVLLKGVQLKDVVFCVFTNAAFPENTNNIIINKHTSLSCNALRCSSTDFIDTTPEGYHIFQMHKVCSKSQFLSSYLFAGYQKTCENRAKKIKEKFKTSEISKIKEIDNCFRDKLKIEIQKLETNVGGTLIRVSESVRELFKKEDSDLLEEILSEVFDYFHVEYQSAQKVYEEQPSKCTEFSEFFQQFKFYSGQLNIMQVTAAIKEFLGKCKPEVVRKFIEYMQNYFQGNRLLVKQQIQKKLVKLTLSPPPAEEGNKERNRLTIIKLLIDKGADPTVKNNRGSSSFGLAACYKNLNVMKLFVQSGVHIDHRDNEKELTILHHVIQLEHLEYIRYFLSNGADVNMKVYGMTSLDFALNSNVINWQIVRLLMEKDANINYMQNLRAFAPLICAVEENYLDVAQYLANKQDNVTTTVNDSNMWFSLFTQDFLVFETVRGETCNYICNLLKKNGKYSSARLFSSAIEECHTNFRKCAFISSLDITEKIFGGKSSFGKAIQNEKWELVKFFVEIVSVDYRDGENEYTALHKAVKTDNLQYVEYFLDQQADVNLKVCEKTSLDLAIENERVNWEMVKLLVKSGADVNCRQNQKGYTPLHYAVEEDCLDMVEFLINKKADVFITDGSGVYTPPQLACHLERKNIMNFFMHRVA